ncbi:hypothetical protein FACS1894122_07180 [Alphaproteobacteria bacterium]|nr:hypothetical protein FACS1894122_07180 [Alphaproteobacteria bacterium]
MKKIIGICFFVLFATALQGMEAVPTHIMESLKRSRSYDFGRFQMKVLVFTDTRRELKDCLGYIDCSDKCAHNKHKELIARLSFDDGSSIDCRDISSSIVHPLMQYTQIAFDTQTGHVGDVINALFADSLLKEKKLSILYSEASTPTTPGNVLTYVSLKSAGSK